MIHELRTLAEHLDDIEDQIVEYAATNLPAAVELYAEYEGLRSAMGKRTEDMAKTIAEHMPDRRIEVPGVGVVERRQGKDRKAWDWDPLFRRTVRAYLDPDGTGEFPTDPMVAVDRMRSMVDEVIGLTPSKGPRLAPLRGLGIDPDEYCTSQPGRVSLQITRSES